MRTYDKWEYKTLSFTFKDDPAEMHKALNQAGEEGWELVSTTTVSVAKIVCVFKRPK